MREYAGTKKEGMSVFTRADNRLKQYEGKDPKKQKRVYYLFYTAVFVFVAALAFSYFLIKNKSFVWERDGFSQHLNTLIYIGRQVRQVVGEFFATGKFNIPMWDFSIGYGGDILTTLHYYGIGDPLTVFYVFVPAQYAEYLYGFLIILRMYLAGVAFSAYCFRMMPQKGRVSILCGALAYVFAGFTLYAGVRHPYFLNPMIYLPLILLGIEKVFAGKRPYLFIVMVAIAASSNYYFFYMLFVLMILYAVIRFFAVYKEDRMKNIFKVLPKFIGYGLIGVAIAGAIFFPSVQTLLGADRMSAQAVIPLFYKFSFYESLPYIMTTNKAITSWSHVGVSSLCLIAAVFLFSQKKREYLQYKIAYVCLLVIFCIPFLGSIMNGFSYPSNRWSWGLCFLFALTLTAVLPEFRKAQKKQWKILTVFSMLYVGFAVCTQQIKNIEIFTMLFVYLLAFAVLYSIYQAHKSNVSVKKKRYLQTAVLGVLIFGIVVSATVKYTPLGGNYVKEFMPSGVSYKQLTNTTSKPMLSAKGNVFFRFEEDRQSIKYVGGQQRNTSLLNGTNGTSYYFSVTPSNITKYMNDTENLGSSLEHIIYGMDERVMMTTLASVKYFVVKPEFEHTAPYGYVKNEDMSTQKYSVFENKYSLPLGYTYKRQISASEYNKLSAVEKQQAMLQGVVVEEDIQGIEKAAPVFTSSNLPVTVKNTDDVEYKDGHFKVNKKNAKAKIVFQGRANAETYLCLQNMRYRGISPKAAVSEKKYASMTIPQKVSLTYRDLKWNEKPKSVVQVKAVNSRNAFTLQTPQNTWYKDKHNFTINMGYNDRAQTEFELEFGEKGNYTFDKMEVVCQSMDNYEKQVEQLSEDSMENEKIETNKVSGTIALQENKVLCLSIPYSKGWTAYVDGKKVELLQANTMYMAIPLEAGEHTIELKYFTPGLKAGILISVAGIFMFGLLIFLIERKRRKN